MAKKQKTFADRAKEIKAKYTRADWDPIERKDLNRELAQLRQEQESVRQQMGEVSPQEQPQYSKGGLMYYDGLGKTSYLLPSENAISDQRLNYLNSGAVNFTQGNNTNVPMDNPYGQNAMIVDNAQRIPMAPVQNVPTTNINVTQTPSNTNLVRNKFYTLPTQSILPFAISAGASAIGDIASYASMNKNMAKSVSLPRVDAYSSANRINLQPEREALKRSYNTATNVMLRNSRDVSNPANAYANQISGISTLTDSLGTQMGRSYMNEENANAQMRNQASLTNAEIGSKEALYNMELQNQRAGLKGQMIQNVANTIPNALKDYRQQVEQLNVINTLGKDYGYYEAINPYETPMQKFRRQLVGGQRVVKNRNYPYIV